jgi:phosphatidylserine/phosphatidylglycerophosphate/cardiolipin synthase-like enzyme
MKNTGDKNKLKIAENIAIGLSSIGLVMAGITQQFMFAIAPISLSLSIGTLRKHRIETESIDRSQEVETLKQQIPNTETLTYQALDRVAQNIESLQSNIYTRIDSIENAILSREHIDELIQSKIDESLDRRFEAFKKIIPKKYNYNLVCGRNESRKIFLQALRESEYRVILVCPWLSENAIDEEAKEAIVAALERGVSIDIGWGNLSDVGNNQLRLSKEALLKSDRDNWKYTAIPWLDAIEAKYPKLLKLKILGTHQKFLICDREFAMLGSHNYLSSGNSSNERELGIKTNDPDKVNELIELFDLNLPQITPQIINQNILNKSIFVPRSRSIA